MALDFEWRAGVFCTSLTALALITTALYSPSQVLAQDEPGQATTQQSPTREPDQGLEEIIVRADRLGLVEQAPTDSIFGFSKSLFETPRAATVVSDTTIDRYAIQTIEDLITVSPNSFTQSNFGVPGNLTVRGAEGDNFFRGFRRVENDNSFPTPVAGARRLEVVRGPAPPIYGPSKIGGFLNFYPKTARDPREGLIDEVQGEVGVILGSYAKRLARGQVGVPFELGEVEGGAQLYAEYENSNDFYDVREPKQALVQGSLDMNLPNDFQVTTGFMFYDLSGYQQTIGWNRLTQELVDDGVYVTGRDTDLADLDGNGKLTPQEIIGQLGTTFGLPNTELFADVAQIFIPDLPIDQSIPILLDGTAQGDAFALDTGVGSTTTLEPDQIFIDESDIGDAQTVTAYFDVVKYLNERDKLSLQFFYDQLDAQIYNSYGFASDLVSDVFEVRGTYEFGMQPNEQIDIGGYVGVAHRRYDNERTRIALSGAFVTVDRRDLSVGPTGNDRIDDPFSQEADNQPWDQDLTSKHNNTGVFFLSDVTLYDWVNILGGVRFDHYSVEATEVGPAQALLGNAGSSSAHENDVTWSISGTLLLPYGVRPYLTYAESSFLELNNAGGIDQPLVASEQFLAESELLEVGLNLELLDGRLFGKALYYEQERTLLDNFGNVVGIDSSGWEVEGRLIATENISFTTALAVQETNVLPVENCDVPFNGGLFRTLPPQRVGLTGQQAYGGFIAAIADQCVLPELREGYQNNQIPELVFSGFGTYTSNETRFGVFGVTFGGSRVSETGGNINGAVVLPSYWLLRTSLFYEKGPFKALFNVTNLTDKLYFNPLDGASIETQAVPGRGRMATVTLTYEF